MSSDTVAQVQPGRDGISIIAAERQRHFAVEGWTPEHDDGHQHGELAVAAACYAVEGTDARVTYPDDDPEGSGWPWGEQWWKPKDDIRNLARAGALIAAEIDRLQRQSGATPSPVPVEQRCVEDVGVTDPENETPEAAYCAFLDQAERCRQLHYRASMEIPNPLRRALGMVEINPRPTDAAPVSESEVSEPPRCKCGLERDDPIHSFSTEWQQMHKYEPQVSSPAQVDAGVEELLPRPLPGEWRHSNGFICCGTLRVLRADFDTNPTDDYKTVILDWAVQRLNTRATPTPSGDAEKEAREIVASLDYSALAMVNDELRAVRPLLEIELLNRLITETQAALERVALAALLKDGSLIKALTLLVRRFDKIMETGPECECPAEGHFCGWPDLQREVALARAALSSRSSQVDDKGDRE